MDLLEAGGATEEDGQEGEAGQEEEEQEDELEDESEEEPRKKQKLDDDTPPSFCHIPSAVLHATKPDPNFPKLKEATKITFDLSPGEVLFLPAGWFHEVTSYGTAKEPIHLALNYWLAPAVTSNAEHPYVDDFWRETHWNPTLMQIEALEEQDEEEDE